MVHNTEYIKHCNQLVKHFHGKVGKRNDDPKLLVFWLNISYVLRPVYHNPKPLVSWLNVFYVLRPVYHVPKPLVSWLNVSYVLRPVYHVPKPLAS